MESWHGFKREPERRSGRELAPFEVGAYWQVQAGNWIDQHQNQVASNMVRKLSEFPSWHEVPNNRSMAEERLFSPLLALLPLSFGWFFPLGVPGLWLLALKDRRGWWVIAPIGLTIATFAVFFAMSRFRFHAVPLFAVGAGVALDAAWQWARDQRWPRLAAITLAAIALGLVSLWSSTRVPAADIVWQRVAWGYLKSGERELATAIVERELAKHPRQAGLWELKGYIASRAERHPEAIAAFRQVLAIDPRQHPVYYNLAHHLLELKDTQGAIDAMRQAVALAPAPDYLLRLGQALEQAGHHD